MEGQSWNYAATEMSKCWFLHMGLRVSCLVRFKYHCEHMYASVFTVA